MNNLALTSAQQMSRFFARIIQKESESMDDSVLILYSHLFEPWVVGATYAEHYVVRYGFDTENRVQLYKKLKPNNNKNTPPDTNITDWRKIPNV